MVVGLLATLLSTAAVANVGATTSTTLPGPAPNQSQINSTQSQVSQIEATLAQEEQQTSILDEKYDTAQQDLQNAQTALQTIATNLVHARSSVNVDKRLVANDAVEAYVYGTPETGFASYFSQSATQNQERNQYTNQIVGNLSKDETSLLQSETRPAVPGGRAAVGGVTGPVGGHTGQDARAGQRARGHHDEGDLEPGTGTTGPGSCDSGHTRSPRRSGGGGGGTERGGAATGSRRGRGRGNRRRSGRRFLQRRCGDDRGRPGRGHHRTGGRIRLGRECRDGGRTGGRVPAGRALRLRRRATRRGIRLLGIGAVGLGPGRCHHSEDDRDAVARPHPCLARRPRAR